MRKFTARPGNAKPRALQLARVLLVHSELAPRLALQTILEAGGYAVDAAASSPEALAQLDEGKYDLVLADSELGSESASRNVLAYARIKDYHPATAVITSSLLEDGSKDTGHEMSIHAEDVPV